MRPTPRVEIMTWRDNWFVKNILGAIPVIGGFFTKRSLISGLDHAAEDVVSIGTAYGAIYAAQALNFPWEKQNKFIEAAEISGAVVGALFIGKVGYRTLRSCGARTLEMSGVKTPVQPHNEIERLIDHTAKDIREARVLVAEVADARAQLEAAQHTGEAFVRQGTDMLNKIPDETESLTEATRLAPARAKLYTPGYGGV